MSIADSIAAVTDRGVTERPPVPGRRYVAFVVHPREPGPSLCYERED
jgi:hypothetical protein